MNGKQRCRLKMECETFHEEGNLATLTQKLSPNVEKSDFLKTFFTKY